MLTARLAHALRILSGPGALESHALARRDITRARRDHCASDVDLACSIFHGTTNVALGDHSYPRHGRKVSRHCGVDQRRVRNTRGAPPRLATCREPSSEPREHHERA